MVIMVLRSECCAGEASEGTLRLPNVCQGLKRMDPQVVGENWEGRASRVLGADHTNRLQACRAVWFFLSVREWRLCFSPRAA